MTRTDLDAGHVLGIAAHDLRGPLGVLAGYSAMLGQPLGGALDDSQREMIEAIQRSTHRLARTADALSALANLEQGAWAPTRVDTSVAEWLTPVTADGDRSLRIDAGTSAETRVAIDPVLMRRALEAMFGELEDGVSAPAPLAVVVSASGGTEPLRLLVGFRPTIDMVEPREPTTPRSGRETVRGLLAARIVEAHGGRLARRADDTFVIDLPTVAPRP